MPFCQTQDISLYYEVRGNGPRLLYISGTGGDLRREPNAFSSDLPDRFEVLGYDQRGLGQTSKPDEPYSMAQYGDDAAALLDGLGWDTCHVMGTSFGGMVAQEFALRHLDRVEKLVLCCTASGGEGGSSYPLHKLGDMSDEEKVKFRLTKNDERINEDWIAAHPAEYAEMVEQGLAALDFNKDDPEAAMGARRQLEARAYHDTWDRLPSLTVPVLVCGGKYDGQASPEVVRNLAGRLPNAELKFFEGGHMFVRQDPAAIEAIGKFLLA